MKKLLCALFTALLLITFSSSGWAKRNNHDSHNSKDSQSDSYEERKERIHNRKIQRQFRLLKRRYHRSHQDAQHLFREYLGTSAHSDEGQIQSIREEYEQQIAALESTISSLQQQLESQTADMQQQISDLSLAHEAELANLTEQMTATCDARLAEAEEIWQADTQQQLSDLSLAHEAELTSLADQMIADCDARLEQAYLDCQAAGDPSQGSDPLQPVNVFDPGITPYAIESDDSGNMFVLDRSNWTVTALDASGVQISQWYQHSFELPMDIAVDSQGNVYVLDQQATEPLQKFGADGAPMPLASDPSQINFPFGLYIDKSNDTIYVTDMGSPNGGRILTFDSAGNLLAVFGDVYDLAWEEYRDIVVVPNTQTIFLVTDNLVAKFDLNGNFLGTWPGDFNSPFGIAAGPNGDIFIADTYSNQIDQYDGDGNLIYSLDDNFQRPHHISMDSAGRLYVADYGNRLIKTYE